MLKFLKEFSWESFVIYFYGETLKIRGNLIARILPRICFYFDWKIHTHKTNPPGTY